MKQLEAVSLVKWLKKRINKFNGGANTNTSFARPRFAFLSWTGCNGFVEEMNSFLNSKTDSAVMYADVSLQQTFGEHPIAYSSVDFLEDQWYPCIDVILNGEPQPRGERKIVPIFHVRIDLEPPRQAWWIRTDGFTDYAGLYNLADNIYPHALMFFQDEGPIVHPDYLDYFREPDVRKPLTMELANNLVNILDMPKVLDLASYSDN